MNIKLIVFDLDGTFYDLDNVIRGVYDCQIDFLCQHRHISTDRARDIFTQNRIFPHVSPMSRSCTEYFASIGIDRSKWAAFRESNFDVKAIDPTTAVAPSVILQFSRKYVIYLLSSNTGNTIRKILERLGIDAALFAGIISSDGFVSSNPFNKREAMSAIICECGIDPIEVLSIGDRYDTDIRPMLSLGGNGVLVKTPRALDSIYARLTSGDLCSGEDFICYESNR